MINIGFSTLPFFPFWASLKSALYSITILSNSLRAIVRVAFLF